MHKGNYDIFHLPRSMSTTGWSKMPHVILSVGFSGMFDDYCAKSLWDITTVRRKCLRSPRHNIQQCYLSSAWYPLFTRSLTIFRDPNWPKHLSSAFKIPLLIEESYQNSKFLFRLKLDSQLLRGGKSSCNLWSEFGEERGLLSRTAAGNRAYKCLRSPRHNI